MDFVKSRTARLTNIIRARVSIITLHFVPPATPSAHRSRRMANGDPPATLNRRRSGSGAGAAILFDDSPPTSRDTVRTPVSGCTPRAPMRSHRSSAMAPEAESDARSAGALIATTTPHVAPDGATTDRLVVDRRRSASAVHG